MKTVLYIDGSPLLLIDIKRRFSDNRIIGGHVVNGNWKLKLSDTILYAFESFRNQYGWGDELVLRNEVEYSTYEEVIIHEEFISNGYNSVIEAANIMIGFSMEDLSKCPQCGGDADNGIDNCIPPSAYMCSSCSRKEDTEKTNRIETL